MSLFVATPLDSPQIFVQFSTNVLVSSLFTTTMMVPISVRKTSNIDYCASSSLFNICKTPPYGVERGETFKYPCFHMLTWKQKPAPKK